MKGAAKCYEELRAYAETVPLVDCHDHTAECGPKYTDPLQVVVNGYFPSDVHSASCDDDIQLIIDAKRPLEERWPAFEKAWKRTCHTGYAQVTKRLMKKFYNEDEMSLEALQRIGDKLLDLEDEAAFEKMLDEANIAVRITDIFGKYEEILAGTCKLPPRTRVVIGLPGFHGICNRPQVDALMAPLKIRTTSLDEYIEGCREVFARFKTFGAVTFKDQSAYARTLEYGNPSRAEAEGVFNWFMADPRRSAAYPDGVKPLDDYLFHTFMRIARDIDLPVQIHTGHMAGIRNDIAKTNAVRLTSVLELHPDVRFDLFHANWPYSGELIYLAKNFPNAAIDFCWANIIDPIYCQNMFKQALSAVPHGKIHGYGSDYGGCVDRAWAHASIARDNVAIALSDMVELEYLDLDEAKEVAYAWLYGNANAFFRLGL
ncbi:MAG TPA: amidohydrolase family protein [Candidatus Hydrogenedentes bacterium]|nr:amidohydrolase family protein [Candidatus Hydrogenedentota bacterium]